MREWVRNIYFLPTNHFLDLNISKASNNITPYRGDNKIVTYLHIMNQWMDRMINEIGDRLYKLERQHVNNHGRV